MKKIEAKIVADSIDKRGNRITSILLTYPRFIHAELMTHRMFSRNSASSRAIPFEKMVKMVEEDPFIPIAWQKDHKGMQGKEYITDLSEIELADVLWKNGACQAVEKAKDLYKLGNVTKQLCNRLLEPFMWHTTLVTATEFENFFELRCPKYKYKGKEFKSKKDLLVANLGTFPKHLNDIEWLEFSKSGAEIHIQALAEAMWDAMNESVPKELEAGEWHIPFHPGEDLRENIIKIATARSARLSYMTFDGEVDYEKDIELHDKLLKSGHMSPFEHCARVMSEEEYYSFCKGRLLVDEEDGYYTIEGPSINSEFGWCNNFKGFIPYRYLIKKYNNGYNNKRQRNC